AYSAQLTAKLSSVALTAVTGYSINDASDTFDYTYAFGSPGAGAPLFDDVKTDKLSQEIRLTGLIGQKVQWLFGAIYTHAQESRVLVCFSVLASRRSV